MATRETPFQSELVQDMEAKGMHAFKASHREKVGVVDLWVRCLDIGAWIECKFTNIKPNFRTEKISMSRQQWSFLGKEIGAGGIGAKIIGYRRETTGHDVHGLLICDPRNQHTQVMREWLDDTAHASHIVKHRGAAWPVATIMARIARMHAGMLPWAHQERAE